MDYRIVVHNQTQNAEYYAKHGTNLLHFLKQNGYAMTTPCNGNGTCGKCVIRFGANAHEPSSQEIRLLGEKSVAEGCRLACQTIITGSLEVYLDKTDFSAKVLTDGKQRNVELSPIVSKRVTAIPAPSIEDQRPDSKRTEDALGLEAEIDSLDLVRLLPRILYSGSGFITSIFCGNRLIGLEEGNTASVLYGVAVDIGTTTIAAYLSDLNTGKRLATYSCLNPQKKFGADVISRIKHTTDSTDGLEEMHRVIIDCINAIIEELSGDAGIKSTDIYEIVLVGNTTMMHFLMKLTAKNIAVSPFIPAATQTLMLKASEIGIRINPSGLSVCISSVAAYIGADTVSAVLASGMSTGKEISLLIDFGTNGEIVLGNSQWMLACSAAAGPCFEGANISHGVGGISGAIDSFTIGESACYTTIGNKKPLGICGTGLIDIASELYRIGFIDETGRMEAPDEDSREIDEVLRNRLVNFNGMPSFLVADKSDIVNNEKSNLTGLIFLNEPICPRQIALNQSILLTQRDIRELQNAKAAIAAGIYVLAARAGIRLQEIDRVYLAGGFGNYIKTQSALNIGLIPGELRGRIESIGNAAGIGAIEMLLSRHEMSCADEIGKRIKYIELSSCREFNDFYVDSMMFPEK